MKSTTKYSVQQIFKRSFVCNAIYCVLISCFICFVFRNNINHSQDPTPLVFFIGAVSMLIYCRFELFLQYGESKRFMPKMRFVIFFGKLLLLLALEVVMIGFKNFWVLFATAMISSAVFLIFIWFVYRKYLTAVPIELIVNYQILSERTKKFYIKFAILYAALTILSIIWLVLECVLGIKFLNKVSVNRAILSSTFIAIFTISAAVNLVHGMKHNK